MIIAPPEVGCRWANEDELPRTARSLLSLANEHGWLAGATYARGTWAATERHMKVIDSIAVRLSRGTERVTAFWHDGKYHGAITDELHAGVLNSKAVKARVATPPREDVITA